MSTLMDLALWKVPALISRFTREHVYVTAVNSPRRIVKLDADSTVTIKALSPVTVRNDWTR